MTTTQPAEYIPKNMDELRAVPIGASSIDMHFVQKELQDEDLGELPETLEYVNLQMCMNLRELTGLHHMKRLKKVNCAVCFALTPRAVEEFHEIFPEAELDLWGCWQLKDVDENVKRAYDGVFSDYLGYSRCRAR